MHPILFESWGGGVQSYLFMMSVAYFVGLGVWRLESRRLGVSWDALINLSLGALLSGLLGARLLYTITRLRDLMAGSLSPWTLWQGGVVYFGGFLFGFCAVWWLAPRLKVSRSTALNSGAAALCFAHAVGRLGCFLNGCCFGSVCDWPWAVSYQDPHSAAPLGMLMHPVQLYEVLGLCLLGLFLMRNSRRAWGAWSQSWGNFRIYLLGYGLLRFFLEFYRGDLIRGFVLGLSTSQWIAIFLIAASLAFSVDLSRPAGNKKDL